MNNDKKIKCVLVGDSGVGKSTFLYKLTSLNYLYPIESTIGVEFGSLLYTYNSDKYKLIFWDTAGQERYRSLIRTYYRDVDIFILMYSIDDKKSFKNIESWWKDIESINSSQKMCFLIANKKDLSNKRLILYQDGQELANRFGWEFFEISNITDVSFNIIIENIIEKYKSLYTRKDNNSIVLTPYPRKKKKCC